MTNWLEVFAYPSFGIPFVIVLGLIWGSFFNVCIVRLPEDKSLIPGSRCPKCLKPIPWYLNIPVLGYLALLGKCRACKASISIQYPLVELATAALYLWIYLQFGMGIQFLSYSIFLSLLLVISVIDLYHQIIPDELSLPGIVIGFVFALLTKDLTWKDSLMGILFGGGIFLGIALLYERLAHREGLGGGDVKLLAMIGAWLGIKSLLPVIIVSSALGSIVGLSIMALQRKSFKSAIPFGPFLAMGGVAYLFWGKLILDTVFAPIP